MSSFQYIDKILPLGEKSLRVEAARTLRKLPVFGYNNNNQYVPDFEWPKAEDIDAMPLDKPIKIATISWKKCD